LISQPASACDLTLNNNNDKIDAAWR